MGFTRGVKRPIEMLCKKLNTPVNCSHSYSTSLVYREMSCTMFSENKPMDTSNYSNPIHGIGIFFTRNYSSQASTPEQMNLIKQLRERTSAPIKDVKSALIACDWDIESAQKELRKRGFVLASKKSSRVAAEGMLALAQNKEKAVVVELNCETDFVARNEIFQYMALSLAKSALLLEGSKQSSCTMPVGPECLEDLMMNLDHPKLNGEKTVQNAITELVAMMGENVRLGGAFAMFVPSYGVLSTYLHQSPQRGVGRIIGLLSLEVEDQNAPRDAVQRVGSEIAMHVVAAKPLFLAKEDVSSNVLGREREILKSQAESTGKSQMAIDKMVEGRLIKYFEEVVLMEQKFVMDDTLNIKTLLKNVSKEVGSAVKIGNYLRMEVGEGLRRLEASSKTEPLAEAA
ncbi:elongation factor Ts, mitochondrial [Olea europaea subsp. europaea]|uniref:Elongation factor Ts, mitochondrial n=1 Tax=Olea europaea subsp. europaea TaxID=158383 RepID=A0A8S0V6C7_OLEEU|nr:elongation factor Ts, mitochondrial [Olea europaea subsp. europaea]